MIKAVFAISHPMQYFNALEARSARGLDKSECAILMFNKPYSEQKQQLAAVVNEDDWGVARYIPYPNYWVPPGSGRTFFAKIRVLWSKTTSAFGFVRAIDDFLANECGELELVATGNYLSRPHRHFLATADLKYGAKEVMMLDEGTSTVNYMVPLRHNPDGPEVKRFQGRFSSKDRVSKILEFITGMTFCNHKSVTFFTIHEEITPPKSDKVEHNKFKRLREDAKTYKKNDEVWLLGSSYIENKLSSKSNYYSLLKQIRTNFGDTPILYLPHRYEMEENLEEIAKLGFIVTRSGMSVETRIITGRILPKQIVAVGTSAIDSISYMFQGKIPITLYKPPLKFFFKSELDNACANTIDRQEKDGFGAVKVRDFIVI